MIIDIICRSTVNVLKRQCATEMKRARIVSRFVIRRAKEVNERLNRLEVVAGSHMRKISSLGRSMKMCCQLFGLFDKRIDLQDATLAEYSDYSSDMWDDLRRAERCISKIEGDMDDNSTDCNAMWNHIRASEYQIKKLQNQVDALTKLNATKIGAFIYGPQDHQMVEKLNTKVNALEKLHSTKIDGLAYTESAPSLDAVQQETPGEVEKF